MYATIKVDKTKNKLRIEKKLKYIWINHRKRTNKNSFPLSRGLGGGLL